MAMAEFPGPYDVRGVQGPLARRDHQHLPDGALSRRVAAGDHAVDGAADGLRRGAARHRPGRDPPPQPRRRPSPTRPSPASPMTRAPTASRSTSRRRRVGLAAFRVRQRAALGGGPLHRRRLLGVQRAVRLRHAGLRRAVDGHHPRLRAGRDRHGPVRPCRGRGSAPRRMARGCSRRSASSSPMSSGSRPTAVHVIHGDTDATPYGWGTFASRSMVISAGACKLAAEKLAAKLRVDRRRRCFRPIRGRSFSPRARRGCRRRRSVAIAEVARAAYHKSHRFGNDATPASWPSPPTIRRAPIPTPAMRRWSRSTSRPGACGSSASSPSRTPACSSIR